MTAIGIPADAAPRPAPGRTAWDRLVGLAAVVAVAAFLLFHRLGEPAQPIWDESYYLTATARYELGYAGFASHPPLGLLLIAAGDRLSGANAGIDWRPIAAGKKIAGGRLPAGFSYRGVRGAAALFGVLAAAFVYLLMVELAGGVLPGLLACSPFLFDTAILAQFRAAQLDAFQLCFAAAALLCLVRSDRRRGGWWPLGFGVACGLAAAVRANGILLLAGMVLFGLRFAIGHGERRARAAALARRGGTTLLGFTGAVAVVFGAHLAVASRAMPSAWPAARADAGFVGPDYQAFLDGRAGLSPRAAWEAVDGYHRFMTADIAGVGFQDANGSPPWGWPFGRGTIVYRWDATGPITAYVALVPNRAGWFVSLAGVLGALVVVAGRRRAGTGDHALLAALLFLWAALFLSDLVLERIRVLYLYHYFLPLTVGWALAAMLMGRLRGTRAAPLPWVVLGPVLAGFVLVSPLALHRPLTPSACAWRQVIAGARLCRAG